MTTTVGQRIGHLVDSRKARDRNCGRPGPAAAMFDCSLDARWVETTQLSRMLPLEAETGRIETIPATRFVDSGRGARLPTHRERNFPRPARCGRRRQ